MLEIISEEAVARRACWVEKIRKISGRFGEDSQKVEREIKEEIDELGNKVVLDHLRLCGDIPESYAHNSTEEKLYSKYTDALLSESYKAIGLKSVALRERADAADVEAFATEFSFVADAKAFRLSRTAKNQKDFKVQAMEGWKRGKLYAMVVCPIYQLPPKSSQIYMQASARNVCIFTYSHLAVLVALSELVGKEQTEKLLHEIFKAIPAMNPSKAATEYWRYINMTMLSFSTEIDRLWQDEKKAAVESITLAKREALMYLAGEREKIMRMTHEEALQELVKVHKLDSRIGVVQSLKSNNTLGIK